MTDATVVTGGDRPAVRLERQLADPPPVVWQALTDREQLRSWFPCDVVVAGGRWEVGAAISFHFPPEVMEMTLSGEVITVDEPNELAFSWGEDVLRFELSASGRWHPPDPHRRTAAGGCRPQRRGVGHLPPSPGRAHPVQRCVAAALRDLREGVRADPGPQEGPPEGYKGDSN